MQNYKRFPTTPSPQGKNTRKNFIDCFLYICSLKRSNQVGQGQTKSDRVGLSRTLSDKVRLETTKIN